ncbi:hypothetical protein TMEC54S_03277 [Thauera mechernichensis]
MAEDQEFTLPPLEERPLVTFALFAYNQEKYIREAVEGAFAQTYEPLEIILSDDCSTDRTFEIMEEMAKGYRGPNTVTVRRNQENLGLIKHINTVIDASRSEIIILAAGDDISTSERTSLILEAFQSDSFAVLVHSKVRLIEENGSPDSIREPPTTNTHPNLEKIATTDRIYLGATGGIRKSLYKFFGPIHESATYEDLVIGFRAALLGSTLYINKPLVLYRQNVGISSRYKTSNTPRALKRQLELIHQISTLDQRLTDLKKMRYKYLIKIEKLIVKEIKLKKARLQIYDSPFFFLKHLISRSIHIYLKALLLEARVIFLKH